MANVFLGLFGKSNNMKILDYLLDCEMDVSASDVEQGTSLSRKTVDKTLTRLLDESIIEVTRTIGKTKMYKINDSNPVSQKLKQINNLVLKEQEEKLKGCSAC